MNSSFNNVSLFIKRAEEYQTKEFIIEAFSSNNIGNVIDVKFIKKQGNYGKSYNGVVVIFEKWNMNRLVQKLLNEMSTSSDGTTKFYFNQNRYWFVNVHKQKNVECEEVASVDSALPDKERIDKLEELVQSMSSQIYYMQTNTEKTERTIMDLNHKETVHHLVNMELRCQLNEKDIERKWSENKLKEQLEKMQKENEILRYQLVFNKIEMAKKDLLVENLQQEVRDTDSMLTFLENQCQALKQILI